MEIKDLSWNPSKGNVPILNSITGNLVEGKIYGIIGPNGSGKTSLIRHLMHLLSVEKEKIHLNEKDINQYCRKELAKNISFVPQNTQIDVDFTVWDVIAMGRMPYQKRFETLKSQDCELIKEAMSITNTVHLKDKQYKFLSGGEAQRVLVARAIAQDTPWIILDEPVSHLDIKHQYEIMESLKKRNQDKGTTVVTILHDLNLTARYCEEVILMKHGAIVAQGAVNQVMTSELLSEVFEIPFQIIMDPKKHMPYIIVAPEGELSTCGK